jgi:hypothetical protein
MPNVKTISGRELRHGAPEETLSPGDALLVHKRDGKKFELRRVDSGTKSMRQAWAELVAEMPPEGPRTTTDLARIIIEDRE